MNFFLRMYTLFIMSCLGSIPTLYALSHTFSFLSKEHEEVKKYEHETLFIQNTITMLTKLTHKETRLKSSGFLPALEKIINQIPLLNSTTVASLSPQLLASLTTLENKVKSKVTRPYRTSLTKAFMSDGASFGKIVDLSDYATFKIKLPPAALKKDTFEKTKNVLNRITAAHLSVMYHALLQTRCIVQQLTKLFEWQKANRENRI
jgi:hypothetical protein